MPPTNGADFKLQVEDPATPGTYIDVADMDNFDDGADQNEQEFPVFGNTKYVVPGVRTVTFAVSGFRTLADAGQTALRNAEKNRTEIKIKVLYDGTNGFTVMTRVKSRKGNAKPEGLQTLAFDFTATAASTAVGTGPAI